jgi:hypothetical protein
MLKSDATAQALLKQFNNIPMPNQNLSDAEIAQYLKYFHWADEESPRARAQSTSTASTPAPAQPEGGHQH